MKILKGVSAASGLVKGVVCLYSTETESAVPHYTVPESEIEGEMSRLSDGFARARSDMSEMIEKAKAVFDKDAAEIFTAHLAMISDKDLFEKIAAVIRSKHANAEHAVNDVFQEFIDKYSVQKGHFRELVHDFVDTRNQLIGVLSSAGGGFSCPIGKDRAVVVAANRLTPSMVLRLNKEHVLGFVTEEGGMTSHATIIARSFGVPIIYGVNVTAEFDCGTPVIVDGSFGKVIIDPDEKTAAYYDKKLEAIRKRKNICEIKKSVSAKTKAGQRIKLKINLSTPEEVHIAEGYPHEGVGLLRTEFLFMERDDAPSDEEQYRMYKKILDSQKDFPVTVRLLDIAADKMPSYLRLPQGANTDMGLRGAIAVDVFPGIYISQIKALLRANENSNLRLLYPMVSDTEDLLTFKNIVKEAKGILKKERKDFNAAGIKEGIMVETPGAVMMLDELLPEVDFVNIGSNDLLQYTLAAARGNMMVENRYHILHPSLIKLVELIVRKAERAGKEACLCGEIASFEEYYPLLLEIGLKSFSVSASKFNDIKCAILHLSPGDGKPVVRDFYKLATKGDADKFFERFM
jgi:phosphotransferase system enzyme I (PtsI)